MSSNLLKLAAIKWPRSYRNSCRLLLSPESPSLPLPHTLSLFNPRTTLNESQLIPFRNQPLRFRHWPISVRPHIHASESDREGRLSVCCRGWRAGVPRTRPSLVVLRESCWSVSRTPLLHAISHVRRTLLFCLRLLICSPTLSSASYNLCVV